MRLQKWMIRGGVIATVLAVTPCTTAFAANSVAVEAEAQENSEWANKLIVDVNRGSALNVREEATTDSEIIGKLNRGVEVEIVEMGEEWTKVVVEGEEGYVNNEFVLFGDEAAEFAAELEEESDIASDYLYSPKQFRNKGVLRYNGYRWTYYSQRVLPGGGLKIPGRHVDENGYVCDGDGYICLASRNHSKGTVIATPLGKMGKVYDRCGVNGTLDVYVAW